MVVVGCGGGFVVVAAATVRAYKQLSRHRVGL